MPNHDLQLLALIQESDPDGWETVQPTDADRAAFRAWVIETYGLETWRAYNRNWLPVGGA